MFDEGSSGAAGAEQRAPRAFPPLECPCAHAHVERRAASSPLSLIIRAPILRDHSPMLTTSFNLHYVLRGPKTKG